MPLIADSVDTYCERHSQNPSETLSKLYDATHERSDWAVMLVGHLEASLLQMLVKMNGSQRILEIGTFTGYSALAMAEAMPENGELITLDMDEESTAIAREFWPQSPHGHKIELKLGPALETLEQIEGKFDLIFIDADKHNYPNYWEACVPRLNPGGVIIVDNVFLGGRALNPETEVAAEVDRMNKMAKDDSRVDTTMLSVRDGVLIGRLI